MKAQRKEKLINALIQSKTPITSENLAKLIGTSEKTVRNYIKSLQAQGYEIQASSRGYQMQNQSKTKHTISEVDRCDYVISKLLRNASGVSIFELSEELFTSESTISNTIFPKIKNIISGFQLELTSDHYQYKLVGEESQKRKLIGYLVMNHNYDYFHSVDMLDYLFPNGNVKKSISSIREICISSNLSFNDYALNNLLIHLMIIIVRILNHNLIESENHKTNVEEIIKFSNQKTDILNLASALKDYFVDSFHTLIPDYEFHQMIAIITLSVDHSFLNLESVIDPSFIQSVQELVNEVCKRFEIPAFESNFMNQFTLHMYNAYQRAKIKMHTHNPIINEIKSEYAPIYDMAIYFAHRFSQQYHISLSEDEIAFISFHIGANLSHQNEAENIIPTILIVENYHNLSNNLYEQIKKNFNQDLKIVDIFSYDNFMKLKPNASLILSTISFHYTHPHFLVISPFLTKPTLTSIQHEIDQIQSETASEKGKKLLFSLLSKDRYERNLILTNKEEYIDHIGNICLQRGIITKEFIQDVKLRENISSTAFTDYLALPHTISQYAKTSFLYIIQNENPINWGNKSINFIFMIGIAEQDMKYFKETLNYLIELFTSTKKTKQLLECESYQQLLNTLFQN